MKNPLKNWGFRLLLFLLIVVPLVLLLAFGLTRNVQNLPSTRVGSRAPDFVLQTIDGKEVSLSSFLGSPLVINFWASWCIPCLQEHPLFEIAKKKFEKENLVILGIVYQDQKENVVEFLENFGETSTVLFDPESRMAIDYGVGGVPETFFIDKNGIIRQKQTGPLTLELLQEGIGNVI